jgi:hypothetical protein
MEFAPTARASRLMRVSSARAGAVVGAEVRLAPRAGHSQMVAREQHVEYKAESGLGIIDAWELRVKLIFKSKSHGWNSSPAACL